MGSPCSLPAVFFPRNLGFPSHLAAILILLLAVPCFAWQNTASKVQSQKSRSEKAGLEKPPSEQVTPNYLQQHYDAARTFQISGDQDQAAKEYKRFLSGALQQIANASTAASDFNNADHLFSESLKLQPDSAEVNLDYAALRLHQEKPREAQEFAEAALRLTPNNAHAQFMLGSALFQQQDYKGAKEQLEKAVVQDPKFEVGYLLGMTYIRLNDLNRATLLFNEMVVGLGDTPQIHLLFGRAYREGDFFDQAVAELKKAISKDPSIKVAHYLLAMAYLERDGDSGFAEAMPELEAEVKVRPQDARTHYMMGYIALKRHDAKLAEIELARAAELDPETPDPLISLGQVYMDAGRLPEAEKAFRRAILLTKDPSRNGYQINRAHYALGRILLQTGRDDEGKKELEISAELRDKPHPDRHRGATADGAADIPAIDEPKTAAEESNPASPENVKRAQAFTDQFKPAIADSYNNLGVIAAGQKDFASAMDYFSKAGEWKPDLATLDRNLGMAAFYANRFDYAIAPLARQLQQRPDDLRVRAALGLSLFGAREYLKVLEVLRAIQAEVDADPGLSYAFAVSEVKTGEYTQGIARLRALEQSNANSADIHTLLGEAFADQGQYAEAIEEYHRAQAINPDFQRAHFLAGLALIRQGSPADAVQELRAALKLDPSDVNSKYHLAYSLIQMKQQKDALPLLREVIQQDPKHSDAYYQLGKLQLEQGDTPEAVTNLEAGARLNPDSDYIHYQLALAYRRESRADDAEREMKAYQTLKDRHRGRDAPQQN